MVRAGNDFLCEAGSAAPHDNAMHVMTGRSFRRIVHSVPPASRALATRARTSNSAEDRTHDPVYLDADLPASSSRSAGNKSSRRMDGASG